MTYLIEFPLHNGEMCMMDHSKKYKFGTVAEAENFIRDPNNNYLSEFGIVNIVKVEKTIVHRVDIKIE